MMRYQLAKCSLLRDDDPAHRWITMGIGGGPAKITRHEQCRECGRFRERVTYTTEGRTLG